jgi:hypothetical protein
MRRCRDGRAAVADQRVAFVAGRDDTAPARAGGTAETDTFDRRAAARQQMKGNTIE